MIINHNMNAMNSHRQMGINVGNSGKAMEKLSSGLRINRAGDDAAGLAISEKMRGQIRGLDQASRNSQDGISLIQTAEGALNETHSILQRMRELAVQSSTDTNVNVDRKAIQDEMNQLTSEIDRIADTTEFNTQKLLDGGFKGKFQIGANNGQDLELSINKMNTSSLGLVSNNSIEDGNTTNNANNAVLADGTYTLKGGNLLDAKGNTVATFASDKISVGATDVVTLGKAALVDGATVTISNKGAKFDVKNSLATPDDTNNLGQLTPGKYEIKGTNVIKDGKLVGDYDATKLTINGKEITVADLGFQAGKLVDGGSFTINGADVSSRDAAQGTIDSVNKAIETVSSERSKLGAVQNRLEHTINNLNTSSENLQASESRVRDVDMAKEMMNFSKNNILSQSAQAMLAQANQQPQGVLQLLR
ncbi:flagellin [Clostridium tetanomorphum]|uniref:flagellin N-terminal helical domain-containing protein n=1 Tax=Clostridium tetanomorphum TaxID=1553 RepID=UPI000D81ED25|nr:flagellin [Clostridium tetanomorphum]SQC03130.1 flagellin [Clostridium tetanomorphum]